MENVILLDQINWLAVLLFSNVVSFVSLLCLTNVRTLKLLSLVCSFIQLFFAVAMWISFDPSEFNVQYNIVYGLSSVYSLVYHLGVDGLSLFFIILSVLLLPICLLCSWSTVNVRVKEFNLLLHGIVFLLINVFCVQDLLLFYIFFEGILIPMFLMIGVWGSRDRKIHAAYQFFLYTLGGSVLMLLCIIYLLLTVGSTHVQVLSVYEYGLLEGRVIWICLFLSFAVKVPMIPFHIWLPEAHVEAPTAGSVILAGILLKMGTYGLLKYSLPLFPEATLFFQPLVYVVSLVGIIYAACTTIRQVDLKKVIAYSSVGHMNYVTLGIVSLNIYGIEGSIYLMLGHGLVSSALFLCVGQLYERYHTRVLLYYGGLVFGMPVFAIYFLFFTLSNISLPGTSNFIGEFLVLVGTYNVSSSTAFIASVGVILGAVYAIWLYNRVMFGAVKSTFLSKFSDLNKKEFLLFFILSVLILLAGLFPSFITDYLHVACFSLLEFQL